MDAISFVLGVRSSTLRSAALKDLIYRSGKKSKKSNGKGKERAEDQDEEEEEEEEQASDEDEEEEGDEEDEEGDRDGERKAWVIAVYIDKDETEYHFQRRSVSDFASFSCS